MQQIRLVSSLLLIGLFTSSCVSVAAVEVPAADKIEKMGNPTAASDSAVRYVNQEGGFSLVLQKEWQVVGPISISQDGITYDSYALGVDPAASGGPGTSRIIIADDAVLSIEEFVRLQCSTCSQPALESIWMGEYPAIRVEIGGGDVPITVEWTFIKKDGQLFGFSLHDSRTLEPLDAVLQTLVFD
jgi:hypothetical protein